MKTQRKIIAATIVGLAVHVPRAGAGIIVTDGTLHVYCYDAFNIYAPFPYNFLPPQHITLVDAPPDQSFEAPPEIGTVSASALIDWQAPFPYVGSAYLSAKQWISIEDGQVGIVTAPVQYGGGTSLASGSLNITEDTPEILSIRINPEDPSTSHGQVSLDAVGGGNVFSIGISPFSQSPSELLVPLAPGQYSLTWSADGKDSRGGYGGHGFSFSMGNVPEPSSGLLLIAAGAMMFARRALRKLSGAALS
jgi:hypothetical protein